MAEAVGINFLAFWSRDDELAGAGGCLFGDTDGTRIPVILEDLLKSSLLVHTVGTVCIRFRAPSFAEKATRRKKRKKKKKERKKSRSQEVCYMCRFQGNMLFYYHQQISLDLCSSSLLPSARSNSAEPEAEHKEDTCVFSFDFLLICTHF